MYTKLTNVWTTTSVNMLYCDVPLKNRKHVFCLW